MTRKYLNVQSLLWLALVLALLGSLKHLASVFASVDGDYLMGLLQAIAIDAGLFALAYSIKLRKASRRSTKPIWLGVAMFSMISIYGNLAYGLSATNGNLPNWIAATKPFILAGSLPILVLFLSELLSDDRQYQVKESAKVAKKKSKNVDFAVKMSAAKQSKIANRRQKVQQLHSEGLQPTAILDAIGTEFKIKDVRTIKADLQAVNGKVTS